MRTLREILRRNNYIQFVCLFIVIKTQKKYYLLYIDFNILIKFKNSLNISVFFFKLFILFFY